MVLQGIQPIFAKNEEKGPKSNNYNRKSSIVSYGFLTVKIAQARLEALRRLYFFVKFKF